MASYLGKISAVVVANTTGFQRNLNSAASDLRNFAGVVQRDITRASSEANKAFSSMLTPLQRLERSLQAASSMKLSFRGFAGAIRTVDELRDRLTRLQGSQVDLVVKASGLRTISQFRQALEGIQQKDFDFAVRFGGTAGLREIRRQIDTLSQESVNATLFAGRQPGVTNVRARLESLRETVDSLSGRSLQLALQVGGEQKLRRAEQQAIGLSKRDLQLFLRVGGREGLDRVIEEIQTVDKTTIDALVSVRGVAELDAVLEKIDQLSPEQITTVLNVLGEQDLVSATQKMRALASAGRQVFEPLAAAASQLPALGLDVEMAFTPGLRRAQRAADALKQEIDSIGAGASANRLPALFREAEAAATRTTQAFARLRQASSAVAAFDDGTSFRFVQPEAAATVERAINAQRQSLGLSPEQFRQGNFGFRSSQISAEIGEIERLNAAREAVFAAGPGFGARGAQAYRAALQEADAAIVSQVQKVNNLLNIYERITDEITAADRARAASSELNILSTDDLQESRRSIARQASDQLPVLSDQDLRDSISSELGLGPGIEDSRRQFSVLGQQVAGLKGQLDQLPLPVRAQFVPAIKQAEDNLIRLRGAADASQEEIQQAADALRQLERSVNFAGRIEQFNRQFGDFGQFLQGSRVNQFAGELQALQQILGRVGVEAGSDAAKAFERLQRAMAAALDPRNLNSEAVIAELNAARTAVINAASEAGGGRPAAIRRQLSRAGDVSRFGADKASLALQQAAFAIDDFFSATGDISQKIRAVQNNVTQLAFILGDTKGLFIGLGVAIAAQAAVALFNFINETEKAKFGVEFLNDELSKSKSLAEENAKAFRDLADSVAEAGSNFGANATRFEIDEALRQQQDSRRQQAEQNIVTTNPRIIAAEAEVRRLEKALEEASTPAERAAAAIDLGRARRDARITRRAVLADANQSSFDGDEVQRSLQQARDAEQSALRRALPEFGSPLEFIRDPFGTDLQRLLDRSSRLSTEQASRPDSVGGAVQLVEDQILQLREAFNDLGFLDRFFNAENASRIQDEISRLEEQRGRLQFLAETELNETLNKISRNLLLSNAEIEGTLQQLSDLGVDPNITSPLADQIASQAEALRQAQRDAERAAEIGGDDGKRLAEEAGNRADQAAEELQKSLAKVDDLARRVALGAEVSLGKRLKGALDQVGDLGPSIVETSLRRAQAELEQIDRQRQRAVIADDDAAVAELDRQRESLREQTTGLEESVIALRSFQSAVEEAGLALTETLVREARQAAERARTEANRAVGEGRFDAADAQQQAEEARQRRAAAEARRVEVENQIRQERLRLEQDAAAGVGDERNAELARRIREGRRRAQDATLSAEQRETARADAAIAQTELDERLANDPAIRAIRDDADRAQQEEFRRQQAARRSRERAGSRASALDSEFGTLGRIAADLGDLEGLQQLQQLEESIAAVRDALESSADAQAGASDAVRAELDRLEREAEQTRRRIIEQSIAAQQDVLGGFEAQTRAAERQLANAGVDISGVQGDLVRARTLRESLVSRRDAITGTSEEDQNRRERLQQEIDAIDEWSQELNASAIAIAQLQQAAEAAALSLQRTVTSERERAAEQSRRQANEAEAVFGQNSPFAQEAFNRESRDEQAARDAQAALRAAELDIAEERVQFEREIQQNPNSFDARRARDIAEQERIAADQSRTTGEREAAAALARDLRAIQDRQFETRMGVQAARRRADEADIALQQRQSADRAFERSRTERQRQEREAAGIAGDLRNLFEQDNIVNPNEQRDLVNATVRNEAQRVAPLLVGFAEQRQNAILQGPSRAALQAQDVTTTQGAAELNRLLRGDDSARDVNLVELRKQTGQLDQVIQAIKEATGVVATVDS